MTTCQLIWSCTVCKGRPYLSSAGPRLKKNVFPEICPGLPIPVQSPTIVSNLAKLLCETPTFWVKWLWVFFSGILVRSLKMQVSDINNYRIRSNYRTYPYKRTVKQFRTLRITASVLFGYLFIKAYAVGTHFK